MEVALRIFSWRSRRTGGTALSDDTDTQNSEKGLEPSKLAKPSIFDVGHRTIAITLPASIPAIGYPAFSRLLPRLIGYGQPGLADSTEL